MRSKEELFKSIEKWRDIVFSVDPIDKFRIIEILKYIYSNARQRLDQVIFVKSPLEIVVTYYLMKIYLETKLSEDNMLSPVIDVFNKQLYILETSNDLLSIVKKSCDSLDWTYSKIKSKLVVFNEPFYRLHEDYNINPFFEIKKLRIKVPRVYDLYIDFSLADTIQDKRISVTSTHKKTFGVVGKSLNSKLNRILNNKVYDCQFGSNTIQYIAALDWYRDPKKRINHSLSDNIVALAKSCRYCLLLRSIAIISERPELISMLPSGILFRYKDGFFFIHKFNNL